MEVTTAVGRELTARQWGVGLLAGAGLVAVVTGVVALVAPHVPGHLGTPVLYLFAVLPVALRWGTGPGAVTAVASSVVFALVFVAPRFTVSLAEPEYGVALAVYLVTAVVVGHLAARSQREAREAARLTGEQAALRRVATLVAESAPPSSVFQAVTREVGLLCAADLARMERYEPDGSVTGVAGWSRVPVQLAVGRRLPLDGPSLAREVREAGTPARLSSFAGADGVIASEARKLGIRSSVGCPIVVDGALWGVIAASTRNDGPFAPDAETQIGKFTELVGTAIGNAAKREELNRLAQEQAALRRVATLVARSVPAEEIFATATEEIGAVLGADVALMLRGDADGAATVLAETGHRSDERPVGRRWEVDPQLAIGAALRTGEPARRDDYSGVTGEFVDVVRSMQIRSSVAIPIVAAGRVWGALAIGTRRLRLPADTERRMAKFTELISVAVDNARYRAEIDRLVGEQAALRRVATLVAHGASPQDVFSAVTGEVAHVLEADVTSLVRFDTDRAAIFLAGGGWHTHQWHAGESCAMLSSFAEGLQNGSAQRLDDITQSHDEADALREEGVVGVVACPVTVEGRVWGAFAVGSRSGALSPDTEHRLVDFTELIGTAIANAESKAEINRLLELRASLRQVATLVARETPPDDIIPTVVDEIGRVLDADALLMTRFDPDGGSTVVATKGIPPSVLRIGERWAFSPRSATSEAVRTGRPVFRDDYSDLRLENSSDAAISAVGVRSTIAIPIVVDGRIWGSLGASLTRPERFPPDGVSHMANFAELLATAVSKARDRFQTLRLLEEQAALRRVATLVARGPSPTEVSTVVAEEVRRLPGVDDAAVCRYEPDGTSVLVVGLGDNLGRVPPGERSPIDEVSSTSEVWRTGRSARLDADRWADAPGPVAAGLRQLEVRSSVASPIVVDGRLWGTVILLSLREPLPSDTEQRLASFTELVAMAIGNAESRAELAASRARVVAASDETRRRIERDLHDGAQQRLVSLGLELRLAQAGVPDTLPELREGIGQIADELTDVVDELREMARGIHPAMLFEGGLRPALRTLARRAPIPVEVDIVTDARFAQQVEVAAYYVVSEALTNAARHASATLATVSVAERDGGLHIAVRDDGVGGADPRRGSGLIGLRDRIEALGGTVKVTSPAGAGTVVRVALPIEAGRLPVSGSRET